MTVRTVSRAATHGETVRCLFAIELSKQSWVIGFITPLSSRISRRILSGGDWKGLLELIEEVRARVSREMGRTVEVMSCYEAGYDGFCEQQSGLVLHRTRHLFIRQQTSVINAIRAHLAEFGVIAPVGRKGIEELLRVIADPSDKRVPDVVRACLAALGSQLLSLKKQILDFDRMILAWHRSNQTSKRLNCIPGVGPLLATALVASVADPKAFRSGRNFSAWIGLVPKQHSSGGRPKLGSISKQGDRYLRSLFVAGALAVIRYAKLHGTKYRPWVAALLARRPTKVAAIALANKLARMAWAMMARGERYNYPTALRV
jgi:transposase